MKIAKECTLILIKNFENLTQKIEETRQKFLISCKKKSPRIQRNLNAYIQLVKYKNILENKEETDFINHMFAELYPYMDLGKNNANLNNCGQIINLILELVIAKKIKKYNGILIPCERDTEGLPDLKFYLPENKSQKYFVECSTVTTSLFNQFLDFLENFEIYYETCQILRILPPNPVVWYSYETLKNKTLISKNSKEMKKINSYFVSTEGNECINVAEKISQFIYITKWNYCYYKEFLGNNSIIPQKVTEKLMELDINLGSVSDGSFLTKNKLYELVREKIVEKIFEKSQKSYCQFNDVPSILVISFSLMPNTIAIGNDSASTAIMQGFSNDFIRELSLQEPEKKNKIKNGLKNIIAVIIDRTSYNWEADFKCHRSNKDNHFDVLYNTGSRYYTSSSALMKFIHTLAQGEKFEFDLLIEN